MFKPPAGLAWREEGWVRHEEPPLHGAGPALDETAVVAEPAQAPVPALVLVEAPAPVAPVKAEAPLEPQPPLAPGRPRPITFRLPGRTASVAAAAVAIALLGASAVFVGGSLFRLNAGQAGTQSHLHGQRAAPTQVAIALPGRSFTRDVMPPELADAAPLRNVYVEDSVPGLIGQTTTTTSDLGGIVTFYVFADPVWAEAFFESPPTAFGCGVCTSMGDATVVRGAGDKAMSYTLYRKKVGGTTWTATSTYVLSGSVVINGLYFPVNVSSPAPSATDLAVPTAYAKAGIQLVDRI